MLILSGIIALAAAALSLIQEINVMGFTIPNVNVYNMARTIYNALTSRGPTPNIPDALFLFTAVVIVAAVLAVLACLTMLLGKSATSSFILSAALCFGLCAYANYQLKKSMPSFNGVTLNLYDGIIFKELIIWGAGYTIAAVLSFLGNRNKKQGADDD